MKLTAIPILALLVAAGALPACDLCAIYSASSSRAGFLFNVSEQFVPFRNTQLDGEEVHVAHPDYVDSSITHLVPGYNFSPRVGVGLSIPVVYRSFRRTDLHYSTTAPPVLMNEKGHESGLGDVALIGRWTGFQKIQMKRGIVINVLGGVKFPTGDTDRIEDEVEQSKFLNRWHRQERSTILWGTPSAACTSMICRLAPVRSMAFSASP